MSNMYFLGAAPKRKFSGDGDGGPDSKKHNAGKGKCGDEGMSEYFADDEESSTGDVEMMNLDAEIDMTKLDSSSMTSDEVEELAHLIPKKHPVLELLLGTNTLDCHQTLIANLTSKDIANLRLTSRSIYVSKVIQDMMPPLQPPSPGAAPNATQRIWDPIACSDCGKSPARGQEVHPCMDPECDVSLRMTCMSHTPIDRRRILLIAREVREAAHTTTRELSATAYLPTELTPLQTWCKQKRAAIWYYTLVHSIWPKHIDYRYRATLNGLVHTLKDFDFIEGVAIGRITECQRCLDQKRDEEGRLPKCWCLQSGWQCSDHFQIWFNYMHEVCTINFDDGEVIREQCTNCLAEIDQEAEFQKWTAGNPTARRCGICLKYFGDEWFQPPYTK